MTFRFIGTECEIVDVAHLREFGEKVELTPEQAETIIGSQVGAALIPEDAFIDLCFTADELAAHKWVSSHDEAPPEFQAKKLRALNALDELRARLIAGESLVEEKP